MIMFIRKYFYHNVKRACSSKTVFHFYFYADIYDKTGTIIMGISSSHISVSHILTRSNTNDIGMIPYELTNLPPSASMTKTYSTQHNNAVYLLTVLC